MTNNAEDEARGFTARKKSRWVLTLLAVALAVFAWEIFQVFSAPQLTPSQKALLSWKGVRAPDFSVITDDGKTIRLSDLKGKRVILNFWATWCPPCQEELPNFIKLRNAVSPADVAIIGVSTDSADTLRTFSQQHGINYPLALLTNLPAPYRDVQVIPATMIIDRNGMFQNILFGPQDFGTLKKYAKRATEANFARVAKVVQAN